MRLLSIALVFTWLILLESCVSVNLDLRNQACPVYLSSRTGIDEKIQEEKTQLLPQMYTCGEYHYKSISTNSFGPYTTTSIEEERISDEKRLARDEFISELRITADVKLFTFVLNPSIQSKEINGIGLWHEFIFEEEEQ